jgi:acyl carrier protein
MNECKTKTREFVSQFVGTRSASGDDEDIFAMGFVNSLFAMQLIAWIENEFRLKVEDEDLDLQNFNSVSAIARFTERKTAVQPT